MNDLDDDLRALFEERAMDVQSSPVAPGDVLKRARRRQIGSGLIAGALALGAVGLGLAGVITLARGPAEVPAGVGRSTDYPERTVTIQGVTVTAPQGWTLLDLWPLAAYVASDVTECSFTGTGAPVGQDAQPTEQPEEVCTTSPAPLLSGIPVLQLSSTDLGMPPVCSIEGEDPIGLPPGTTVLYVTAFPSGRSTTELPATCPAGAEIATFDRGDLTYATVVAASADAPSEDVAFVRQAAATIQGQGLPVVEAPAANGPGYVLSAGSSGGFAWRLEAGLNPPADIDALGIGGVLIVTDDHGSETMTSVRLPTDDPVLSRTDPLGAAFITWRAADPTITAIQIALEDGSAAPATLVGWPDSMQGFLDDAGPLSGSLWWVVTSGAPDGLVAARSDGSTVQDDPNVIATGWIADERWVLRRVEDETGKMTHLIREDADGGAGTRIGAAIEDRDVIASYLDVEAEKLVYGLTTVRVTDVFIIFLTPGSTFDVDTREGLRAELYHHAADHVQVFWVQSEIDTEEIVVVAMDGCDVVGTFYFGFGPEPELGEVIC